jgi:uncharacterized protein YcbX
VRVEQLWRFPVKSLGGERLETCRVLGTGLEGDRRFGLRDTATGYMLTARREPLLLQASSILVAPEEVVIVLPRGERTADDGVLSDWLGRPVQLVRAGEALATYEGVRDPGSELDWELWQGPPEALHDSAAARVSLLSTATSATGTPAASAPTSCSTALARTSSSDRASPSVGVSSP